MPADTFPLPAGDYVFAYQTQGNVPERTALDAWLQSVPKDKRHTIEQVTLPLDIGDTAFVGIETFVDSDYPLAAPPLIQATPAQAADPVATYAAAKPTDLVLDHAATQGEIDATMAYVKKVGDHVIALEDAPKDRPTWWSKTPGWLKVGMIGGVAYGGFRLVKGLWD